MRVLLAEDDPNVAVIAKLTLERLGGCEVTVVTDGQAALAAALAGGFDVILLDEMMPKMSGLGVAAAYHAATASPKPVIFLSAKSQEADVREFAAHGAGFIPKPFDPMKLPDQIRALIRRTA